MEIKEKGRSRASPPTLGATQQRTHFSLAYAHSEREHGRKDWDQTNNERHEHIYANPKKRGESNGENPKGKTRSAIHEYQQHVYATRFQQTNVLQAYGCQPVTEL